MRRFLSLSLILILSGNLMFRGFAESKEIKLSLPKREGKVSLEEAFNSRQSVRKYLNEPLTLDEISQVLWAAYGKNKWNKLTAPSAGALYPLAIYLVANNIAALDKGLYKYNNNTHGLVLISSKPLSLKLSQAALNQPWVKDAPALVIICADYEITTSRYGNRGRRYVDIEAGHVGQNIYLQAETLDLGTVAVGAFNDREAKEVLKIEEDPLYIMPLGRVQ
jgi:SagB-type dehydrogenase family enzyme